MGFSSPPTISPLSGRIKHSGYICSALAVKAIFRWLFKLTPECTQVLPLKFLQHSQFTTHKAVVPRYFFFFPGSRSACICTLPAFQTHVIAWTWRHMQWGYVTQLSSPGQKVTLFCVWIPWASILLSRDVMSGVWAFSYCYKKAECSVQWDWRVKQPKTVFWQSAFNSASQL